MATGPPTEGPKPPDVTLPTGSARGQLREQQRTAAHRHPALRAQADAAPRRTIIELWQHDVRTGKSPGPCASPAANLRNGPFQRRLDRRRGLVEIRTVEAKSGLGPQAVARAQTGQRNGSILQKSTCQHLRLRNGNTDLKAILAGVAGPGYDACATRDHERTRVHEAHGGAIRCEAGQHALSFGSLQREQSAIFQHLNRADLRTEQRARTARQLFSCWH